MCILRCLLFVSVVSLIDVYCSIVFLSDTDLCLDEVVEYNCTLSAPNTLTWRILQEDGSQFGSVVSYTSNGIGTPVTIGGVFSVGHLSTSPIISNISFTVQSSINGYTIICEEFNLNNVNFTTTVIDNPGAVTIDADSFTSSSVNISWTESPSRCNTIYNYTVSSNGLTDISVMDITGSPTVVNGLVSSYERQYCVVVTAVDFSTRNSDQSCFVFSAPPSINDSLEIFSVNQSNVTANVSVEWEGTEFDMVSNNVYPILTGYRIEIFNSTGLDDVSMEVNVSNETNSHTFTEVSTGRNYTVQVFALNGVGSSSPVTDFIYVPGLFVPMNMPETPSPTTPEDDSLMTSVSVSTVDVTSTVPTSTRSSADPGAESSPIVAIAGGVAGGVITVLVVIIIILLVVYFVCAKSKSESVEFEKGSDPIPLKETVTRAQPETGQGFYQDPSTIERQQAPTGDMYSVPEKGSKRRAPPQQPEQATYQDPNTIQREQAPTGDMYALPQQKPVYSKVNKDNKQQGSLYAELDLEVEGGGTRSPTQKQPLIHNQDRQQQAVTYADVRNL